MNPWFGIINQNGRLFFADGCHGNELDISISEQDFNWETRGALVLFGNLDCGKLLLTHTTATTP